MSRALSIVRRMAIEGRHLSRCMSDAALRREGERLVWRARRIARRLGYNLKTAGVDI